MPAADDGEWSNWCSNVVCVRTKSSKEEEGSANGPVYVQPIVVRSVYRDEPVPAPVQLLPPKPTTVPQRRRLTRLIQTQPLILTPPVHYEGVSRISLNLKAPVISSSYKDFSSSEVSRPPFVPSRRSPVRNLSSRPLDSKWDFGSFPTSGRDFSPAVLPSPKRASSLPPSLSSAYARRSSVTAVPIYSATSGYGGRPLGDTRNVTSSLRRGSVDVSHLSSGPDLYKGLHLRSSMPPVRSDAALHNTYRRGSLSVLGPGRPTYRSSTVTRLTADDELKPVPLSAPSETLSSLRSRAQHAREKLDTHRSLIDMYLPGGSRAPSVDSRFANRSSDLDADIRRTSISSASRAASVSRSRAPSTDRSELISALARNPASSNVSAASPNMSAARRRIRNVLYKVSGDDEFLN